MENKSIRDVKRLLLITIFGLPSVYMLWLGHKDLFGKVAEIIIVLGVPAMFMLVWLGISLYEIFQSNDKPLRLLILGIKFVVMICAFPLYLSLLGLISVLFITGITPEMLS